MTWSPFIILFALFVSTATVQANASGREDTLGGGQPGRDFPILTSVPKRTNFNCQGKIPGYYADEEYGCQVFHICHSALRKDSFLCPNGTIFHQSRLICDWWYNVDCASSMLHHDANIEYGKPAAKPSRKDRLSTQDQSAPSNSEIPSIPSSDINSDVGFDRLPVQTRARNKPQQPQKSSRTSQQEHEPGRPLSDPSFTQPAVPSSQISHDSVGRPLSQLTTNIQRHRFTLSQSSGTSQDIPSRRLTDSDTVLPENSFHEDQQRPNAHGISQGRPLHLSTSSRSGQHSSHQFEDTVLTTPVDHSGFSQSQRAPSSHGGRPLPPPKSGINRQTPVKHTIPAPTQNNNHNLEQSHVSDLSGKPLPSRHIISDAFDSPGTSRIETSRTGIPLPSTSSRTKQQQGTIASKPFLPSTVPIETHRQPPRQRAQTSQAERPVSRDSQPLKPSKLQPKAQPVAGKPLPNVNLPQQKERTQTVQSGRPLPSSIDSTIQHRLQSSQVSGLGRPLLSHNPDSFPGRPQTKHTTSQQSGRPLDIPKIPQAGIPLKTPNLGPLSNFGRPVTRTNTVNNGRPISSNSHQSSSQRQQPTRDPNLDNILPPRRDPVRTISQPTLSAGRPLPNTQHNNQNRLPPSHFQSFLPGAGVQFPTSLPFPHNFLQSRVPSKNSQGRPLPPPPTLIGFRSTARTPSNKNISLPQLPGLSGRPLPPPRKVNQRARVPQPSTGRPLQAQQKISGKKSRVQLNVRPVANPGRPLSVSTQTISRHQSERTLPHRSQSHSVGNNVNSTPRVKVNVRPLGVAQSGKPLPAVNANSRGNSPQRTRTPSSVRNRSGSPLQEARKKIGKTDSVSHQPIRQSLPGSSRSRGSTTFLTSSLGSSFTQNRRQETGRSPITNSLAVKKVQRTRHQTGSPRRDFISHHVIRKQFVGDHFDTDERFDDDIFDTNERFDDDRFDTRELVDDDRFDTREVLRDSIFDDDIFDTREIFDDGGFNKNDRSKHRPINTDERFDDDHFDTNERFDNKNFGTRNTFVSPRIDTDERFDDGRARLRVNRVQTKKNFNRNRFDTRELFDDDRFDTRELFDDDHLDTRELFDDDRFDTRERFNVNHPNKNQRFKDQLDTKELFDDDNFDTIELFDDGFDRFDVDPLLEDDRIDRFGNAAGFNFGRTARRSNPTQVVKKVKKLDAPSEVQLPPSLLQ